jgi:hypothetical protein
MTIAKPNNCLADPDKPPSTEIDNTHTTFWRAASIAAVENNEPRSL